MGKIEELAKSERPRERLQYRGAEALTTAELLAILLRTGKKGRSAVELGQDLLVRFDSLQELQRASVEDLASIPGIGPTKAIQLKAAFELGARTKGEVLQHVPLDCPQSIFDLMAYSLRGLRHEVLMVLSLNTKLRLIRKDQLSQGTVDETIASLSDILSAVLRNRSKAFVLVHNHPSGDPHPSQADITLTKNLRTGADTIGIRFLDHVIVGSSTKDHPQGYFSFKEAGYL